MVLYTYNGVQIFGDYLTETGDMTFIDGDGNRYTIDFDLVTEYVDNYILLEELEIAQDPVSTVQPNKKIAEAGSISEVPSLKAKVPVPETRVASETYSLKLKTLLADARPNAVETFKQSRSISDLRTSTDLASALNKPYYVDARPNATEGLKQRRTIPDSRPNAVQTPTIKNKFAVAETRVASETYAIKVKATLTDPRPASVEALSPKIRSSISEVPTLPTNYNWQVGTLNGWTLEKAGTGAGSIVNDAVFGHNALKLEAHTWNNWSRVYRTSTEKYGWELTFRRATDGGGWTDLQLYMMGQSSALTTFSGYYLVYYQYTNYVELIQNVNGVGTVLLHVDNVVAVDNNPHTLKVERDDYGNFEVFMDGVSIGTANDTTYMSGSYTFIRADDNGNVIIDKLLEGKPLNYGVDVAEMKLPEPKIVFEGLTTTDEFFPDQVVSVTGYWDNTGNILVEDGSYARLSDSGSIVTRINSVPFDISIVKSIKIFIKVKSQYQTVIIDNGYGDEISVLNNAYEWFEFPEHLFTGAEVSTITANGYIDITNNFNGTDTVRIDAVKAVFTFGERIGSDDVLAQESAAAKQSNDSGHGIEAQSMKIKILPVDIGETDEILSWIGKVNPSEAGAVSETPKIKNSFKMADAVRGSELLSIANEFKLVDGNLWVDEILNIAFNPEVDDAVEGSETTLRDVKLTVAEIRSITEVPLMKNSFKIADVNRATTETPFMKTGKAVSDVRKAVEKLFLKSKLSPVDLGRASEVLKLKNKFRVADISSTLELPVIRNKFKVKDVRDRAVDGLKLLKKITAMETRFGTEAPIVKAKVPVAETRSVTEVPKMKAKIPMAESMRGAEITSLINRFKLSDLIRAVDSVGMFIRAKQFLLRDAGHSNEVARLKVSAILNQSGRAVDTPKIKAVLFGEDLIGFAENLLVVDIKQSSDVGQAQEYVTMYYIVDMGDVFVDVNISEIVNIETGSVAVVIVETNVDKTVSIHTGDAHDVVVDPEVEQTMVMETEDDDDADMEQDDEMVIKLWSEDE